LTKVARAEAFESQSIARVSRSTYTSRGSPYGLGVVGASNRRTQMDLSPALMWWIVAALTIGAELLVGSFYLLMVGLGMAAGALAAHAGLPLVGQLLVAAGVGGLAVFAWYRRQRKAVQAKGGAHMADVNVVLDVGETVYVQVWDAEGFARVKYRGAQWSAKPEPGTTPEPGVHRVKALDGNRLVLQRV
jgi:membrane protein implicated in regulation of membrane protease activity